MYNYTSDKSVVPGQCCFELGSSHQLRIHIVCYNDVLKVGVVPFQLFVELQTSG